MSAAAKSKADGALIIDTKRAFYTLRGIGSSGRTYCLAGECEPFPHSDSGRHIFVGSSTWVDVYLHEIGHAINWSHSYFLDPDSDQPNEYTNPMDVMSGSIGWVGTKGINRYAAGWIDPDDVKVWELGDKKGTYRLDPVGVSDGYQMLVIGDNHSTWYYMLGARVRDRFDEHLPKEGVERYLVDESADTDCGWDAWDWCPGTVRTIVAAGKPSSTDHVLGVTESAVLPLWDGEGWVDVYVSVEERKDDSFVVRVSYS